MSELTPVSPRLGPKTRPRSFGTVRWYLGGLVIYLAAIAVSAIAASIYHSFSGGFGAITDAIFALGLVLPAGFVAATATLLAMRVALPPLGPRHARLKALAFSWLAHAALLAVFTQPWTPSFDPSIPALVIGFAFVGPAATALGLLVGLPRSPQPAEDTPTLRSSGRLLRRR